MLCVGLNVCEMKMAPSRRRSFFKKFKLKVTNWYFENGKTSTKLPATSRLAGNKSEID